MNTLQAIGDFVEFYLSPDQSVKTIELFQLKILQKAQKLQRKTKDDTLLKVAGFREILKRIRSVRKGARLSAHFQKKPSPEERFYLELVRLSPQDCLMVIAQARYGIDDSLLSLILKRSEPSIAFRRSQLQKHFLEEGVSQVDPATIAPRSLTPAIQTAPTRQSRNAYHVFQSLPFAARFAVETLIVLSTLVFLMWVIPEIRNMYENAIQKRINDYLVESSLIDSPAPEGTSKDPKVVPTPAEEEADAEPAPTDEPSAASKKQPRVNSGETWRFSFTGSMTNEIENDVLEVLKKLSLDQHQPLTVPGGIQFDFMTPIANLIPLKISLEDMTSDIQRKSPNSRQSMMSAANMSWYKRKMIGGRKIPPGQVQVMIWISTL